MSLRNEEGVYEDVEIEGIDDIYQYADRLKAAALSYDSKDTDTGTDDHGATRYPLQNRECRSERE